MAYPQRPGNNPRDPRPSRCRWRAVTALTAAALTALTLAPAAFGTEQGTDTEPGTRTGDSLPGNEGQPRNRASRSVEGLDVSGHQPSVDWSRAWANGARFAYVKATEGTGFRNDQHSSQYNGARDTGMLAGAYHYALPDRSTGAEQAHYFVDNGGDWSPDGKTLPGALDIENNPYGETCYGMDPATMSRWIADFSATYQDRTGRHPMIYTNTNWWNQCTGHNPNFAENHPLWLARYNSQVGELPAGWDTHTIWQHGDSGTFPGGQDRFNGGPDQLVRLANG